MYLFYQWQKLWSKLFTVIVFLSKLLVYYSTEVKLVFNIVLLLDKLSMNCKILFIHLKILTKQKLAGNHPPTSTQKLVLCHPLWMDTGLPSLLCILWVPTLPSCSDNWPQDCSNQKLELLFYCLCVLSAFKCGCDWFTICFCSLQVGKLQQPAM